MKKILAVMILVMALFSSGCASYFSGQGHIESSNEGTTESTDNTAVNLNGVQTMAVVMEKPKVEMEDSELEEFKNILQKRIAELDKWKVVDAPSQCIVSITVIDIRRISWFLRVMVTGAFAPPAMVKADVAIKDSNGKEMANFLLEGKSSTPGGVTLLISFINTKRGTTREAFDEAAKTFAQHLKQKLGSADNVEVQAPTAH